MNRRQDRRGAARGRSAGRLLRYLESVRHATDTGLATALRDPIERAGALEALREQGLLEADPPFGLAPVPGQARRYFPYCKECRSRPCKMSCTRAYARRLHGDPDAHTVVSGALFCRPCSEEREALQRVRAWSLAGGASEAELPALPARVVIDRDPCPHQGPWAVLDPQSDRAPEWEAAFGTLRVPLCSTRRSLDGDSTPRGHRLRWAFRLDFWRLTACQRQRVVRHRARQLDITPEKAAAQLARDSIMLADGPDLRVPGALPLPAPIPEDALVPPASQDALNDAVADHSNPLSLDLDPGIGWLAASALQVALQHPQLRLSEASRECLSQLAQGMYADLVGGSPTLAWAAREGYRTALPETDGGVAVATGEGTMAQTKPAQSMDARQQRHDDIAAYVDDTKDTPGVALDPALEEAGLASWRAADPNPA